MQITILGQGEKEWQMKWFKHISDSLDDPFIFDLMDKFGADGYLVFFGVLEIYSREFKSELNWNLSVTRSQLRSKFHKRQDTLIINCLKHIQNSGKWDVSFKEGQVIIFIPKFTEIIDEWTKRKLSSGSVVTPKKHKLNKNKEEEVDKEKKIYKRKFLDFVLLTNDEHEKLISKFGKTETLEWIERLNEYVGSKGKKYKSHYHTILTWSRKDKKNDRHNI